MNQCYQVKVLMVLLVIQLLACPQKNIFERIEGGDLNMVFKGTYHGHGIFLRDGGEYRTIVDRLRVRIAEHPDLLTIITRKFFIFTQELDYKFKYVMYDKENDFLVLRYFARIHSHPVYAGYQIQFIFKKNTEQLVKIYTAEVPLE